MDKVPCNVEVVASAEEEGSASEMVRTYGDIRQENKEKGNVEEARVFSTHDSVSGCNSELTTPRLVGTRASNH